MLRSITFTVLISKHSTGFVATCPGLPECIVLGKSRVGVYKAIKDRIRRRLLAIIEQNGTPPSDPVVSVKHLRINMLDINKELDLR